MTRRTNLILSLDHRPLSAVFRYKHDQAIIFFFRPLSSASGDNGWNTNILS
jgi:hypothetical protein